MPDANPLLAQIGQISIRALDLDRAVEFYRERLGLNHLFTVPRMAFFDCGGIYLMLALPEPDFDHPSSVIYFKVDDIQAAFKALSDKGVQFEGGPHVVAEMPDYVLWMAFFRDSEENLLSIMSRVARQ